MEGNRQTVSISKKHSLLDLPEVHLERRREKGSSAVAERGIEAVEVVEHGKGELLELQESPKLREVGQREREHESAEVEKGDRDAEFESFCD